MVFLDRAVLTVRPDFTDVEHGQIDDFSLIQVAPGSGTPWKSTTKPKRRIKFPFLLGTKTEWREFRDFFAAMRGSQKGFWLPLWITDYESYESTQGGTAVKIQDINLSAVFVADEQFAYMALIDTEQIEPHEIANITILGGGEEQLNLATVIAGSFAPASSVCCGLIFCRLSGDAIRYQYLSDSVVRCELEFVELPQEYVTEDTGTTPIYLYEFTRGLLKWRMTNWPEPLVVDSECWSPDNIAHGSIHSGIDFLPEDLDLTIATDHPDHPLRYYLNRSAFEVTELVIWELNQEAISFDRDAPIYKGRVGKVTFPEQSKIESACSSLLRVAEQNVPRMQQQRTCGHRFGDVNCGVSLAVYEITGTLTVVNEDYVQATAFLTEATARSDAQWFALGKVTIGVETRMVVGQSTSKLYIDEPFYFATAGDSATAVPGCNKRISHCDGRYMNIARSAQFPYMPNANPQFEALMHPKPIGGKKG